MIHLTKNIFEDLNLILSMLSILRNYTSMTNFWPWCSESKKVLSKWDKWDYRLLKWSHTKGFSLECIHPKIYRKLTIHSKFMSPRNWRILNGLSSNFQKIYLCASGGSRSGAYWPCRFVRCATRHLKENFLKVSA